MKMKFFLKRLINLFRWPAVSSDSPQTTLNYYRSAKKIMDITDITPYGAIAEKVINEKRSYLHHDRLYTLYNAIINLARVDGKEFSVAEIGVHRGGGSYFLASLLCKLGMDDVGLQCFDTFDGHALEDINSHDNTEVHYEGKFGNTEFEDVKKYLSEFQNVSVYKGRVQEHQSLIDSCSYGFVHADVDLYEPTLFILKTFGERLIKGGIIIVDDFDAKTCPGTRDAVDEFIAENPDFTMFPLLTCQCVLVKL